MTRLRGGAASWLAFSAVIAAVPASAGPLVITPTTVEFAKGRHSAAIEVTNQGDSPSDLQFRAYDWSQSSGEDRLSPTTTLVISPPIATLAPHATQTFRIVALDVEPATQERSFRLKLNELPRPRAGAVSINIEFSLPVFMTPEGAAPSLSWRRDPSGAPAVIVSNTGGRRVRLSTLGIDEGTRHTDIPLRSSSYILAGATRRLPLAGKVAIGGDAHLTGTSDAGVINVPLVDQPAR